MIFSFLVLFACSFQDSYDFSYRKRSLYAHTDTECFYDYLYTTTFIPKSLICFIRCTFKSINSTLEGGAIFIDVIYFETNNIINNCTFEQCNAKSGGAFYFNYKNSQNCSIQIQNSIFNTNSAYSLSGGAIHIYTNQKKSNIEIKQCIFKSNSALYYGGSIYFKNSIYTINKCNFSDNFLLENPKSYSNYGAAIYSTESDLENGITESIFSNNTSSNGGSILFKCIYQTKYFFIYNCTFINNSAEGYGGSISFRIIGGMFSFKECSFVNNSSKWSANGGAISFSDEKELSGSLLNISMNKCYFNNNTAYSTVGNSYGGAISVKYVDFTSPSYFFSIIDKCHFFNNSAISNHQSYGAAFFVRITKKSVNFKINNIFTNLSFVNNSIYSIQKGGGGAISFNFEKNKFNFYEKFEECIFNGNKVISNSSSHGGAIHYSFISEGYIKNCIFINNFAETFFVNNSKVSEFGNDGGAVYLFNSAIRFTECLFDNNCCFGKSLYVSVVRNGGAIYSFKTNVKINKCCFKNNSLFDSGSTLNNNKGGACCFLSSKAILSDCEFIDNNGIVDNLNNFTSESSKIFGGAVYSGENYKILKCENCNFTNNKVLIKNDHKNEFAGAIYLIMGEIINCTFNENSAFNGCDLVHKKYNNSILTISNCIFNHNLFKNIKSFFYFHVNSNGLFPITFTNNKVFNDIKAFLFDGKMEAINSKLTFRFKNNCISPFDQGFYKTSEILIYMDNSLEYASYNSAFESSCHDSTFSQTIPQIETPNTQIKSSFYESISSQEITTTPMITQTEQIIIETQNQTESKSTDDNKINLEKALKKLYIFLIAILISQIGMILLIGVLFMLIIKKRNRFYNIEPQEFVFS